MFNIFKKFKFPNNKLTIQILRSIEHEDFETGGARVPAILVAVAKERLYSTSYPLIKSVLDKLEANGYIETFHKKFTAGPYDTYTVFYRLTPEGRALLTRHAPKLTIEVGKWYIGGNGSLVQITHLYIVEPATYRGNNGLTYGSDGQYIGLIDQEARSLAREYIKA